MREWWQQYSRQGRVMGAAVLVGLIVGVSGILFCIACQIVTEHTLKRVAGYVSEGPRGEPVLKALDFPGAVPSLSLWALILLPAAGGLVSALFVHLLAPEAEGHGTDSAIHAYHEKHGLIGTKVPIAKLLSAAVTIGTGGSGGREGPIAQIGAGIGSVLARWLKLSVAERRILLAAGIGAGVSAVFRAPLAGALFAAEVLYWSPEFEADVIIPAGIASTVAYCTFCSVYGFRPLFDTPPMQFDDPGQLLAYLVLALWVAGLAAVYVRGFYWTKSVFDRWKAPALVKPMTGAFLSGLVGVGLFLLCDRNHQALSVLSFGYGILQDSLLNLKVMPVLLLLAVAVGKIMTTSLTIGSGGSGGVFGPSMVIGGCGGGALGLLLHQWWPALVPEPATFMVVGMAGFFAAAARTPFSTMIIVSEMTGDYLLLLPSLWVCTIAFLASGRRSLFRSQVQGHLHSPAHRGSFVREVLADLHVHEFMPKDQHVPVLKPSDRVTTVFEVLNHDEPCPVIPVINDQQELLGVVHLDEAYLATQSPESQQFLLVEDMMRTQVIPLEMDQTLDRAMELFFLNDLPALPVIRDADHRRVLGLLRRNELAAAYLKQLHGPIAVPKHQAG